MTQTIVHRYYFTAEEVASALIDNVPPREEIQFRFVDGYVEIDIVNPRVPADKVAPATANESEPEKEEPAPASDEISGEKAAPAGQEKERKIGRVKQAACALLASKAFQVFLEVKTEEAARAILLRKCGVDSLEKLDNNKTAAAAFHDLDASYEAWCMAD